MQRRSETSTRSREALSNCLDNYVSCATTGCHGVPACTIALSIVSSFRIAAGLLLVLLSALNRKFYCKYLCPLGAALAIPGKFRIFDWLRRHRECGRPCQVCAAECEVLAIRMNGEINPNECHYCLDCQVTYWNDHKCPPEVERRKRREKSGRARELVKGMESTLGASGIEDIPIKVEPRPRDPSGSGSENR